jgi:hypothetical protein
MCYACLSIVSLRRLDSGMAGSCWCQKFFSIISLTGMDDRLEWEICRCLIPVRCVGMYGFLCICPSWFGWLSVMNMFLFHSVLCVVGCQMLSWVHVICRDLCTAVGFSLFLCCGRYIPHCGMLLLWPMITIMYWISIWRGVIVEQLVLGFFHWSWGSFGFMENRWRIDDCFVSWYLVFVWKLCIIAWRF